MSHIRKKGVSISKQIVIGTYSFEQVDDQKRRNPEGSEMYLWYCLVRSPTGEDLSYWIKSVEFTLHESFVNRERIITEPPFVIEERGWGEFDLQIKLVFQDPVEKPVTLFHKLALRAVGGHGVTSPIVDSRGRCVRHEALDTIVFYEPHEWFYDMLLAGPSTTAWERREEGPQTSYPQFLFLRNHFSDFGVEREQRCLSELLSAAAFVQNEVHMLRRELIALELQNAQLTVQQQMQQQQIKTMPEEQLQSQQQSPSSQQPQGNSAMQQQMRQP